MNGLGGYNIMTTILSTNIEKGGVGKTTLTFNGGYFLAKRRDKRVLLIDMDESMNLTNRFIDRKIPKHLLYQDRRKQGIAVDENYSVKKFFLNGGEDPNIISVDENIDLIAGSSTLSELLDTIKNEMQRMYLLAWFYRNREKLEQMYDYILIDTHNDHSMITDNALVLSDIVIAPVDVDKDSMEKLASEEQHLAYLKKIVREPLSNQSYMNARIVKIGNKVGHIGEANHTFKRVLLQAMEADPSILGYFPFREATFGRTKTEDLPITVLEERKEFQTKSFQQFYEHTYNLYDKIFNLTS